MLDVCHCNQNAPPSPISKCRGAAILLLDRQPDSGHRVLDGIDYSCIFEEPSALEQVYAIFMNVLEIDDSGVVIDADKAQHRAAQYIRSYVQGADYQVDPPFEDWEVALHVPWE